MTSYHDRMEEARDLADFNEGRESRRDPRSGEVECDRCDGEGGYYVLVTSVDERAFCCEQCNGSGVMPAPESNVHPLFAGLLAPFAPKDRAA